MDLDIISLTKKQKKLIQQLIENFYILNSMKVNDIKINDLNDIKNIEIYEPNELRPAQHDIINYNFRFFFSFIFNVCHKCNLDTQHPFYYQFYKMTTFGNNIQKPSIY